jgi:hypothetical protein
MIPPPIPTHPLWHLLQVQSTGTRHDPLLINCDPRERRDLASGRNDDILRLDLGLATFRQLDIDLVRCCERCLALDVVDTVLLEQEPLNTAGERLDGRVLGGEHLRQIELYFAHVDAARGEIMRCLVINVRVVQPDYELLPM